MNNELKLDFEYVHPTLFNEALKRYETEVKIKDFHPVYIIFNKVKQEYFVSIVFKKETWEAMPMYIVVQ